MFVGITRARRELYLSRCRVRAFRGQQQATIPSQFLKRASRGADRGPRPFGRRPEPGLAGLITTVLGPHLRANLVSTGATPEFRLMTAAELAGGPKEFRSPIASGVADADDFCVGQVVSHPQYGLGRIVASKGRAPAARGRVAFAVGPRGRLSWPSRRCGPWASRALAAAACKLRAIARLELAGRKMLGYQLENPRDATPGCQYRSCRDASSGSRRARARPGLGCGAGRAGRSRRDHDPSPRRPPAHPGARRPPAPRDGPGRLNLELALEPSIVTLALEIQPDQVTFVPERRDELTTEGGLDVAGQKARVAQALARCRDAGIDVALFIDPDSSRSRPRSALGADRGRVPHRAIRQRRLGPRPRPRARVSEGRRRQRASPRAWNCTPATASTIRMSDRWPSSRRWKSSTSATASSAARSSSA